MWPLLRQRNFALLWWGGLISLTGDWMLGIALPAFVYTLTGSTLQTGAMWITGTLPRVLFGSFAGVFVDRWDRRSTMVVTNVLQALCLAPLLFVSSAEWVWLVYIVTFVQTLIGLFFSPAESALLPQLVEETHLVAANALGALNNNLARLIGPALGGIVALTLGLWGVALIDAVSFLVAALLIGYVRPSVSFGAPVSTVPRVTLLQALVGVWQEWIAGLRIVGTTPLVRVLFVMTMCMAVGEGVLAILFVPWVTTVIGGKALELGWLMSAQAVGGVLGGVVMARLGLHLPVGRLLGPSTLIFGILDLMLFTYPLLYRGLTPGLLLIALVGLPAAAVGASFSTLLQRSVSDSYRGRLLGARDTTFALLTLIGMVFASFAGDKIGIVPIISIQGGAYIIAGVIALLFLPATVAHLTPEHMAR